MLATRRAGVPRLRRCGAYRRRRGRHHFVERTFRVRGRGADRAAGWGIAVADPVGLKPARCIGGRSPGIPMPGGAMPTRRSTRPARRPIPLREAGIRRRRHPAMARFRRVRRHGRAGDRPQIGAHRMFESIHPFADGNGRIGRLLVALMMKRRGCSGTVGALFGESVRENRGHLYLDAVREPRSTGDFTSWTRLGVVVRHARCAAQQRPSRPIGRARNGPEPPHREERAERPPSRPRALRAHNGRRSRRRTLAQVCKPILRRSRRPRTSCCASVSWASRPRQRLPRSAPTASSRCSDAADGASR